MRSLAPDALERNYAKEPLTRAEVGSILAAAGSVEAVMNGRHAIAKENCWKGKAPSKTAFVTAVIETPNLLRRPIVVRGTNAVVGPDADTIRSLLS